MGLCVYVRVYVGVGRADLFLGGGLEHCNKRTEIMLAWSLTVGNQLLSREQSKGRVSLQRIMWHVYNPEDPERDWLLRGVQLICRLVCCIPICVSYTSWLKRKEIFITAYQLCHTQRYLDPPKVLCVCISFLHTQDTEHFKTL